MISIVSNLIGFGLCISNSEILNYMENKNPWILYSEQQDLKTYIYDDKELQIVKIEKKLNPDITKDQIFETILNLKNYNNVLTDKKLHSEFVKAVSDTVFGYQKTKNYIPFTRNRHLVFKLYQVNENRLEWIIIDKNNRLYDKFKHRRNKELEIGAGAWEFLKINNSSYLIHYLYVDPNINVPNFILNRARVNSAELVMDDVINYIELNNNK